MDKDLKINDRELLEQDFEFGYDFIGIEADEVKANLETCLICGSRLVLKHFSDFTNLTIQEKSKCLECGNRPRNRLHQIN